MGVPLSCQSSSRPWKGHKPCPRWAEDGGQRAPPPQSSRESGRQGNGPAQCEGVGFPLPDHSGDVIPTSGKPTPNRPTTVVFVHGAPSTCTRPSTTRKAIPHSLVANSWRLVQVNNEEPGSGCSMHNSGDCEQWLWTVSVISWEGKPIRGGRHEGEIWIGDLLCQWFHGRVNQTICSTYELLCMVSIQVSGAPIQLSIII